MRAVGLTLRVDEERERRDAVDQAWYPLLHQLALEPVLLPNVAEPDRVVRMLGAFGLVGLILTGGNDLGCVPGAERAAPERDRCERALIEACSARRLPVLGVCRGMQHLIAYHGGTLCRIPGHTARPHALDLIAAGLMPLQSRELVNSYHQWGIAIGALPRSVRAVALAPDGSVEAVVHRDLPQWGILWHPERHPNDPRDAEILGRLFNGNA